MRETATISFLTALALSFARIAAADSMIQTKIHVSSNTGGNVTTNGENISTGQSRNSVDVHTAVNGQVIEDTHIVSTSSVNYEHSYATTTHPSQIRMQKKAVPQQSVSMNSSSSVAASASEFRQEVSERHESIISVLRTLFANFQNHVRIWLSL